MKKFIFINNLYPELSTINRILWKYRKLTNEGPLISTEQFLILLNV